MRLNELTRLRRMNGATHTMLRYASRIRHLPEAYQHLCRIVNCITECDDEHVMSTFRDVVDSVDNITQFEHNYTAFVDALEHALTNTELKRIEKYQRSDSADAFLNMVEDEHYITRANNDNIKDIILAQTGLFGTKVSLNNIDVSRVSDMSELFSQLKYNGNISEWNVSNVKNMYQMFKQSTFNNDISKWNVSKVEDMHEMFADTNFNKDISKWDVSNVDDYDGIFDGCPLEDKPEYQPKFED